MLDATPLPETAVPIWQQTVAVGDILAFRFPVSEGGEPPKLRPCVVLDVDQILGERFVLLAYGTSATTNANTGYEVRISRQAALQACGLERTTRFVGARRRRVSLSHAGFEATGGNFTPWIGRLSGAELDRLNDVRARICAEQDIAADRRDQRRASRRRAPLQRGRGFTVEYRKPRRRAPTVTSDLFGGEGA